MGGVGVPAPEIGETGGRGPEEAGGATPPVSVRTQAAVVQAWLEGHRYRSAGLEHR